VGGRERGRDSNSGTLYACMKKSEWNPFKKIQES
jgi:hypothetical protein